MTIKIPVQAETGAATQELDEVRKSAEGIADGVDAITQSARDASKELAKIDQEIKRTEISAQRLARIKKILGQEYGRPVSDDDARMFAENFDSMRSNRSLMGGSRIRKYDSFEAWYKGNRKDFVNPREADRYKRNVMDMASSGTDLTPAHNEGGGGGGINIFSTAKQKGISGAKAFAGGMLAVAGITSVMAMAGRAADMATEEAVGADTLKRSLGDLGVDFDRLRDSVRGAGDGLGVASVESMRLAQHMARVSNADGRSDIAGDVRSAIGFARATGIDPNSSATFFAMMRQQKVTGADDPNSRRLAVMIADAIDRGKATAKTDEMIDAVANFTAQATRLTLTTPNMISYLGTLAGLTRTGLPGMTPSLASEIIGTADSSMRRGGAMGEASMNFAYNAFGRGLSPIQAQMLMSGGLFGTSRNVFGDDSLARWYADQTGDASMIPGDATSDTTNLVKVREHLKRQGFSTPMRLDALKNFFGLQSIQQAMVLDAINPEDLTGTQNLLSRSGVDIKSVSADSIMSLSKISGASDADLRGPVLNSILGRSDMDEAARSRLRGIAANGTTGDLREEMARIVAARGQEETDGQAIRTSLTDLNNTLTRIGENALPIISGIRDGVTAIVNAVAPDSPQARRFRNEEELAKVTQKYAEAKSAQQAARDAFEARVEKDRPDGSDPGALAAYEARMARIRRRSEGFRTSTNRAFEDRIQELTESLAPADVPVSSIDKKSSARPADREQKFSFEHNIMLFDQMGNARAEPWSVINTVQGAPKAAGQ